MGRPSLEDSRRKMAQVRAVAGQLFSERGYRSVTMRDVADAAQVSTRTLYKRYADKLSLFIACLDNGEVFPKLTHDPALSVDAELQRHAAAIIDVLSTDTSQRLVAVVYREGRDFPELLRAAEENQALYLVRPLALYLEQAGLAERF